MMDLDVRLLLDNLGSVDNHVRHEALESVLQLTQDTVGWADDVWDELVAKLADSSSYQRSIGLMVLCNLAKSVTAVHMAQSLPVMLEHTKDEKFITSRQCLQNIWKVAAAHGSLAESVLEHLQTRFLECADEPHANLLRRDIIESMKSLCDVMHDPAIRRRAQGLIQTEPMAKFRTQYEKILGTL